MPDSPLKKITTVPDIVAVLKPHNLERWLGMSPQHINNVLRAGRLPYPSYVILQAKLKRIGYQACPSLWGIRPLNWRPPA